MSTLSLKISLEGGRVTKTIQFDPQTTIFDACKIIRDKFAEAVHGQRKLSTHKMVSPHVEFVLNMRPQ